MRLKSCFLLNLLSPDAQKMKKSPRFLLCRNPLIEEDNLFILCSRTPKVLFEVIRDDHGRFSLLTRDTYEGSEADVESARAQASKWFIACMEAGKIDIYDAGPSGK